MTTRAQEAREAAEKVNAEVYEPNPDEARPAFAAIPEPEVRHSVELGKDAIFRARDLQVEQVEVPEWGGHVFVRGMTAGQRDRLEASMIDKKGQPAPARLSEFRTRMVITCVVDSKGVPLFTVDDLPALQAKSMLAVRRIVDVARRLSGMTEDDESEIVGNSENNHADASSSV